MDATQLTVDYAVGAFRLDVSVTFEGGWTAVFGPSGSGKTTLLECVAGLRRPRGGRIAIDGEVVFDAARGIHVPPRDRRIGYVSQTGDLFAHLTVRQNLAFGLRPGLALEEVADMLEIADVLAHPPSALSGGQRQRVALGRALLSAPRLLLLDEPLSSLDAGLRQRVMASLARVRARLPVTCLYVTHSISEVLALTDRVTLMADGRAEGCGQPSAVLGSVEMADALEQQADGVENFLELPVGGHDAAEGVTRLDLGDGQWLRVPLRPADGATRVRVAIRADDIIVALGRPEAISAQNMLSARVTEIVTRPHAHYVRCALNGRDGIWSHITPAALARMGLTEGAAVTLIVKSHAVRCT